MTLAGVGTGTDFTAFVDDVRLTSTDDRPDVDDADQFAHVQRRLAPR